MHIKIDDTVQVITGDDRGARGRVLSVNRATGRLTIEGVNLVYKHVRRSQKNPQGGRLSMEMPVQLSNVMYVCKACNTATRTGVRYEDNGAKHRYCKKCGADGGQLAPAKAQHAKKS